MRIKIKILTSRPTLNHKRMRKGKLKHMPYAEWCFLSWILVFQVLPLNNLIMCHEHLPFLFSNSTLIFNFHRFDFHIFGSFPISFFFVCVYICVFISFLFLIFFMNSKKQFEFNSIQSTHHFLSWLLDYNICVCVCAVHLVPQSSNENIYRKLRWMKR